MQTSAVTKRRRFYRRAFKFPQGKSLSMYLEVKLIEQLDAMGAEANMSRSELVEALIRRGLVGYKTKGQKPPNGTI